jgi:hypothetical protein
MQVARELVPSGGVLLQSAAAAAPQLSAVGVEEREQEEDGDEGGGGGGDDEPPPQLVGTPCTPLEVAEGRSRRRTAFLAQELRGRALQATHPPGTWIPPRCGAWWLVSSAGDTTTQPRSASQVFVLHW